ncbi:hypothetical protein BDV93DRAFT_520980 [Ceratobasidium sp. AG-I]|nr:hypothetical protein BDV93DRAFT_520980 [Ceratobasidium sp. AG-I]
MTCVLPYRLSVQLEEPRGHMDVLLGGRDKSVIVCDCDVRWSVRRLSTIMTTYLRERLSSTISEHGPASSVSSDTFCTPTVAEIVEKSLKRIHVFRPTSTISLATTLMALPAYHRSHMPNEEIGMLMVDSLSAFFWTDRWAAEQAEQASQLAADLPPAPHASTSTSTSTSAAVDKLPPLRSDANPLRHVLTAILQLRRSLGMVTFLTNWGLTTLESQLPSSITYFRQHLRTPYPSPFDADPLRSKFPLVHHITIPSQGPPPFEVGTAVEDAVEDQGREELVKRLKLRALVRTIAKRPGESRAIAESEFEFAISEDSVLVL